MFIALSCSLFHIRLPAICNTPTTTRIHPGIQTMTECTDDEDPTRTDSWDDSVPEGSVPLHRLCDRCRQMSDKWDKSDAWFGPSKGPEPFSGYETYELCTLAELRKSRHFCHLCEMLSSQIERGNSIPSHEPIVCQIGPSSGRTTYISTLGISLLLNGHVIRSNCISVNKDSCNF